MFYRTRPKLLNGNCKFAGWKLTKFGIGRLIALIILFGLVGIRIVDPTLVKVSRAQSFDAYQRIKPREYKPLPVTILDIDEESIRTLGQWPWPRTKVASLVDKLMAAGAVVVGFDIVFAEANRLKPGGF